MLDLRYEPSLIPWQVSEGVIGAFAAKVFDCYVAILYPDGEAKVISLSDYSPLANISPVQIGVDNLRAIVRDEHAYLESRDAIAAYLNNATVPSSVYALRRAAPLNGSASLSRRTLMYRYTAAKTDICFDPKAKQLRAHTYLAPADELRHATTGYGAVGRYSLPCPYPARYLHEYILLRGTQIDVGTVEPQFNQSGGGVEVRLKSASRVLRIGSSRIADY